MHGRFCTREEGRAAGPIAQNEFGAAVAGEIRHRRGHPPTLLERHRHPTDRLRHPHLRLCEQTVQVSVNILVVRDFAQFAATKQHRSALRVPIKTGHAVTEIRLCEVPHVHTAQRIRNLLKISDTCSRISIIGQQPAPIPDNQVALAVPIQVEALRRTVVARINACVLFCDKPRSRDQPLMRHKHECPVFLAAEHVQEAVAVEIPESRVQGPEP